MPNRSLTVALGQLCKLLDAANDLPDQQLLDRFTATRDESAFAMLVKRHGPMVRGVCQSILRHTQDAEDAKGAWGARLTKEARESLERLGRRDMKTP